MHIQPDSLDWIFFDLDNTIWDHASASRRAIGHICTRYGLPPMQFMAAFKQHNDALWGELAKGRVDWNVLRVRRFELVLNQMACGCSSNDAEEMSRYYLAKYLEESSLLPGAVEAVAFACSVARVGVLTNGARDVQLAKLAYLPMKIEIVQCANEGCGAKPSPDFFRAAQQSADDPSRLLMVGDSFAEDVVPVLELGWRAVWVRHHQEIPENPPKNLLTIPDLGTFSTLFACQTAFPSA